MKKHLLAALWSCWGLAIGAQPVVLLYENFNNCGGKNLPAGWQIQLNGNPNALWYIGKTQNTNANGNSIDGTCMFIIDDDATGENTPGFVLDVVSPAFDASNFTTVYFQADIHYRDWYEANENFSVWVTDGIQSQRLLELGDKQSTGEQFDEFKTYRFDLSFRFAKPNVQLIFRYNDNNGDWAWWAGFDNVLVIGDGTGGRNVVLEDFNDCQKPAGWQTQILSGVDDWLFSPIFNTNYHGVESMNGSCFAFFDDDILGETAPYSTARLISPWFDGAEFAQFTLSFDLVHRYWRESLTVLVENSAGEEHVVDSWAFDIGGPLWDNYVPIRLDLSPFRDKNMRIIFEYSDQNTWAWWTGIDNVKITGTGISNDLCSRAISLTTGNNCLPASNRTAVFDGPPAQCSERNVGSLWYHWQANVSGWVAVSTDANFNEVVTVFSGGCNTQQFELCNNRDEHGFTGEKTYFQAQTGKNYLIRVSGQASGFGAARGEFCIKIEKITAPPPTPANDNCTNAKQLTVGNACTSGQNIHANISNQQLPKSDRLARADVWYSFQIPTLAADERLLFRTAANFSDIITVYRGGCNNLTEVSSTAYGQQLEFVPPTPNSSGQTYRVQVAGIFATIEGNLCAEVIKIKNTQPSNAECAGALHVPLGGSCVASNNRQSVAVGRRPSCAVKVEKAVWFKFTAPASGAVRMNTGAQFEHVVSVWEGNCNAMQEVFCRKNPLPCDGYFEVGNLVSGKNYWVQVASTAERTDFVGGDICLKILDIAAPPDYLPLVLNVKTICTGIQTAELKIETTGGRPPIQITDPTGGQPVASGEPFVVVARDAAGCEVSEAGIVKECTQVQCQLSAQVTVFQPVCHNATDGSIYVTTSGGTPPYRYAWSVAGQSGSSLQRLGAGVYYLTVTDAEGCELVLSRTLNNPPPIQVSVTSATDPNYGQSNGEIRVHIQNGTAPYTFKWLQNGQLIATSQHLFGVPAGTYLLQVTDDNGCTATLSHTLKETVTAAEPADGWSLTISPNPAHDFTFLTVIMPQPTAQLSLTLYDATGKMLWQQPSVQGWSGASLPIPTAGLPSGIYQLRIQTEQRRWSRQVVVE